MERLDQIALATSTLPGLKQLATDVLGFLNGLSIKVLPWEDAENNSKARADYMTRTMVLIQYEHLSSVLSLVTNGHDRDSSIIARSMVEVLAQLRWALLDEPVRTDEWFWYTVVLERLQLLENLDEGRQIEPGVWDASERLITLYGSNYFNKRTRTANQTGNALPPERERYRYRWHQDDISFVIANGLNDALAVDYWRSASAWSHASPLYVFRAMDQGDGPTQYEQSDPREAAQGLYMSIHSCLNTFGLANSRFGLSHQARIDGYFARLPGQEI